MSPSLIELGALTELATGSGVMVWGRRSPVLAYNAAGRLFIVYPGRVLRPSTDAERREYARTHGGQAGRGGLRDGRVAIGPWTTIGKSTSITYTTRKWTDRELVDYVHEWGEGGPRKFTAPTVRAHDCGSSRCPWDGALWLAGGSYTVTERGIVG